MPSARQSNFSRGESAPEFSGRTEQPEYLAALRTCKNFLPIAHGSLKNRPGTKLVATAGGQSSLRGFVFSDTQTFALEFGDKYLRFHQNGGQVQLAGTPDQIATPRAIADVPRLKLSQAGDVIVATHPPSPTQDIARLGNTNWTITPSLFAPPAGFVFAAPTLVPNGWGGDNGTPWVNPHGYTSGDYAFDGPYGASFICLAATAANAAPNTAPIFWARSIDATHVARAWVYVYTVRYRDALGRKRETLQSAALNFFGVCLPDRPVSFQWVAPTNAVFPYTILGYGIYKGRNGLFGWIGDADPTSLTFKDDGKDPSYAMQPPRGTNPFVIADGVNQSNTTKWPGAVVHHELRRVYARPDSQPNHFYGSRQDDYTNFDVNFPVQDTDSYDFGIASARLEEIRSMLSLNRLLLFTGHAVFGAEGPPGQTIKPTGVQVKREVGEHGASYLQPLGVGNTGLYVTAKGNYVRDVYFDWRVNGLDGNDLSLLARHLLDGHTIVEWCYAAIPWSMVWAVRDDGLLLSLTYDRSLQAVAWAQHPRLGTVESVCSVPEGTEDAVYIVANRNGTRYVERMSSRIIADVRTACFLDGAVSFDGRNAGATTMTVTGGIAWAADEIVNVASSVAAFAATDIGDQVVILPDGLTVLNADGTVNRVLTPVRIVVTAFTDNKHVAGRLQANLDVIYQNNATAAWGWARSNFAGLGHLNGMTVNALADGAVQGPFVVAGGAIRLVPPAVIAAVGLSYHSRSVERR